MKKLILALCLLLMVSVGAAGEEMQTETAPTVAEIALTMRPESEEPTHLTVGNSTKVSGSFFTTQFGNNTSDIDVRYMLHGYNPIVWMNQLEFTTDPMVVDSLESADTRAGRTYTIRIVDGLTYNDGVTPVTAEDYVFSYLLLTSPQFAALGANTGAYAHVVGYEAFSAGETDVFSGVRLIDERTFSVTVKAQYEPYFYELSYLSVYPYPIGVIAPGCEVRDDGEGAYIANIDETAVEPVFTAELLQSTVLDAENGYLSHPYLTCGPYKLVSYDRESGTVEFAINEFYVGNYEGVRPVIDTVTLVPVLPQDIKLLSAETKDGVCFVNFSADFISKISGGTTQENLALYSIVNSLCELDKVNKVQILVEGKKPASLGSVDLSQPFEADYNLFAG